MAILVISENDGSSLKPAVSNTVSAAKQIGEDIHILVTGSNARSAAEEAASMSGVSKVLYSDAEHYANPVAEDLTTLIVPIAKGYTHVLAAATSYGKNLMPRVAALLNVAQLSDIVGVESEKAFLRPIYAGNAIATVESLDEIKIITVRATAFEACPVNGTKSPIAEVEAASVSNLSTVSGQELTESERPELTAASTIVSGGRGMGSGENFDILEKLADKLGAAVGASRAAVDSGFVPNDYQVGQTGKVVAPELYIAVGISGAIQHLAGMKDSKVIVAINKDPDAPIFGVADYGLVADLFEVVPQLTETL